MTSHPHFSHFPTPEELRALMRDAERERARCIRRAIGRMVRAVTATGAPRRHRDAHLPTGAVGARR
ncbi:hypothetical protein [Azospirillum sp. ST 5-10]|uniref:hypothetical protein n=1 Tax=unclassified Azospirillum TaxID=2630922 RepID=UPI003F49F4B9